jgi:hypothetical protein
MNPFWKRRRGVAEGEELRERRPEPGPLAWRLAFAGVLTAVVLAAVGVMGGLDYPISLAGLGQDNDDAEVQAAVDQYEELVTICPSPDGPTVRLPLSEAEDLLARDPDAVFGPCPPGEISPKEEEVIPPEAVTPAVITEGCPETTPVAEEEEELAFTGVVVALIALAGIALVGGGLFLRGGSPRVPLALIAALLVVAGFGGLLATGPSSVLGIRLAQAETDPLANLPAPVVGETVNLVPCGAHATVKLPDQSRFRNVGLPEQVAIGAVVNTRRTPVVMVSATGQATASSQLVATTEEGAVGFELAAVTGEGATRTARFEDGKFRIVQKKTGRAVTEARMTGRLRGCEEGDKRPPQGRGRVVQGDGEGLHRIRGQLASATIRGTEWKVTDRCDGSSEVKVQQGEVKVRDLVKKSSELLRSGESALIEKP